MTVTKYLGAPPDDRHTLIVHRNKIVRRRHIKRLLLMIAGLSLIPISLWVLWIVQPTDPINVANLERIKVGMTEREVEQILGGPATADLWGWSEVTQKGWKGRGRNVIYVVFVNRGGGFEVDHTEGFQNPSLWERAKECFGG
jgi:hypothetical protein